MAKNRKSPKSNNYITATLRTEKGGTVRIFKNLYMKNLN